MNIRCNSAQQEGKFLLSGFKYLYYICVLFVVISNMHGYKLPFLTKRAGLTLYVGYCSAKTFFFFFFLLSFEHTLPKLKMKKQKNKIS